MPPTTPKLHNKLPDFYAILEIEKSASTSDVRKAYRKLALKWHPDKNPDQQELATKKFKEISEAYEVLSDPAKRITYDRGPAEDQLHRKHRRHGHFHHGLHENYNIEDIFEFPSFVFRDPTEIFREFFGGTDPFEEMAFGLMGHHRHRCTPRVHRNRQRHSDNPASRGLHSSNIINISAEAAGNAGAPNRNGRCHRSQRERESQSLVSSASALDPFGAVGSMMSPFGLFGSSFNTLSNRPGFGSIFGGGIQNMFGGMDNLLGGNGSLFQSSFSSSSLTGGGDGVQSISTTTRTVNGQKITTTRRTMSDGTTSRETTYQNVPGYRRQSSTRINSEIITID